MAKIKFIATHQGQDHTIEVDDQHLTDGRYLVRVDDDSEYSVDAQTMPSRIISLLIDNRSYDVDLERVGDVHDALDGRMSVRVRGRVVRIEILNERRKRMKEAQASHFAVGGLVSIKSPMPGKVIKFLLGPGDEVQEGQGCVVVEAMKMENELRSPKKGTIKEILVAEGSAVDSGTVLMVVE